MNKKDSTIAFLIEEEVLDQKGIEALEAELESLREAA